MAFFSFLEFWGAPPQASAQDPVKRLFHAYQKAQADLDDLKGDARDYIIPIKDSKGRLSPAFDPDKADDVSALADQIDSQKSKIKTISKDIEDICVLAGGPSMVDLETKHESLKKSIILADKQQPARL